MPRVDVGNEMISTGITVSTTAETQVLGPGGVGIYRDLRRLVITNRSTSLSTLVTISSSSGSGSTGYKYTVAERGGVSFEYTPALLQNTANSAWVATITPAVTVDIVVTAIKKVSI
jgi:hypothetical protein